ncbi:ferritin-like domain-containing protein [Nocardia sp. CNY236]|uniref:ferritin-like domain-containing protein n=1 Tax=Nocardia sp. CNY236 TaxID=1169152 RepID=UPI000414BACF|nr:ferritin-like domain-containing protein [Nocardia sp. CNY236]
MTEAERQALENALIAEHGAIFAYGVVAAYAAPGRAALVAEHTAAHRARRDATADTLAESGTTPHPDAAYLAPFPVTDPVSAARLATAVESDTAVAWRAVVERSSSETIRGSGIDALTDAAVRLATWQSILGTNPTTVAFPGSS